MNQLINTEQHITHLTSTILWTALITPFTDENTIDFDSLANVARIQADAGNGLLLLGSTGEGLALSSDEQQVIVEFICQLNLNAPIMVAVGGYQLAEQLKWIKQCNHYSIDAFLLATPIYAKPGAVGQTAWFECLLDAAKYPCMLYNVPSRSGVEIPVATVKALAQHPQFWAMKEASGNINKFLAYRKAIPNIALFSGEDAMMPHLVNAGAKGLVSVCANAWPKATQLYVQQSLAAQTEHLFPVWHSAIESLFAVANPIPVKILMHLQGVIQQPLLRAPLTHLELSEHTLLRRAEQTIMHWQEQQVLTRLSHTKNFTQAVGV